MNLSLSPPPRFREWYPGTNTPLAGGYLYTVQPGTNAPFGSTPAFPQTTYTDSTGTAVNTNPIVLDASGECDLWLSTFTKLVLYDLNGNLIWSRDNVSSQPYTASSTPQWVVFSGSVTYIGTTQFSVAGNQLATFIVGTAIQATLSGGTIIGQITAASFGGGITTVTVQWANTVMDATVMSVATGIVAGGVPSSLPIMPVVAETSTYGAAYTDLFQTFTMNSASATTFTLPAAASCPSGAWIKVRNIGTGAVTIANTVDGVSNPVLYANLERTFWTDGTNWYGMIGTAFVPVPIRQTVLSGPVDANGLSSFGGSTGSTTVTMTGTLIATAANGFGPGGQQDVIGSGTNLSWTGLSTTGTMYLFVLVNGKTLTTFAGTLAPVYEWGGTPSVTNNSPTFNIQAATGYLGNGATAPQAYWVCVGEVGVTAGTVSAITWYQLMGRYKSAEALCAFVANTTYSFTHNLGIVPKTARIMLRNLTGELGYSSGDVAQGFYSYYPGTFFTSFPFNNFSRATRNSGSIQTTSYAMSVQTLSTTGVPTGITNAYWNYWVEAERGW